jgi:uncharacterized protein HemX
MQSSFAIAGDAIVILAGVILLLALGLGALLWHLRDSRRRHETARDDLRRAGPRGRSARDAERPARGVDQRSST